MSKLPERILSPEHAHEENAKKAKSPLYGHHPTCTVYKYLRLSKAEQAQVTQEHLAIERQKRASPSA